MPYPAPFHGVAVKSDPTTGLLLGYFGAVRVVAYLSQTKRASQIQSG
jgi:hypothetical protein